MPYCTLPDKAKLFFEIYGSELDLKGVIARIKPTIVVLHGGPNVDHTFHVPFFQLLAEQAQIIFYNHRGCGRSDGDNPADWNLKQWAKDLNDFCEQLSLNKPYIAGISFGGWVALQYAVSYPNNYQGLILLDTEAFFDKKSKLESYRKIAGDKVAKIVEAFYCQPSNENNQAFFLSCVPLFTKKPFPEELARHCLVKRKMDSHFKQQVVPHYNLLNQLSIIKSPVLYINGTINPHHSAEDAKRSAAALTHAQLQLHLLAETGFSTIDDPERVAQIIKQFLDKNSSAAI
ncbi:MAG: hypothetical protein A3E87_10915 [Gammaproteobacteria bacterium RIFCSPHIGHO2_12_FULL_35_23]|nr:MAG: hypothetical protein A3E87_10915 [Gammaproteobacteria bacterium RIFCSPHIGHO2_12_FULL_35_23]